MQLRSIKSSEFVAGMVVHFYGARFRLRDDVKTHAKREASDHSDTTTATGDWLGGQVSHGYFGPNKPWKFQGNDLATWSVEVTE